MEIDLVTLGIQPWSRIVAVFRLVRLEVQSLRVRVIRQGSRIRIWGGINETLSSLDILLFKILLVTPCRLFHQYLLRAENSAVRGSLCAWISIVRVSFAGVL